MSLCVIRKGIKLCKGLKTVQVKKRDSWRRGKTERVSKREMHLDSVQVSQYPRNSLIKQRAEPNQTLLDFSLAQRSKAVAPVDITLHTVSAWTEHTLQRGLQPLFWDVILTNKAKSTWDSSSQVA